MLIRNTLSGIHSYLYIMPHHLIYSWLIHEICTCTVKSALPHMLLVHQWLYWSFFLCYAMYNKGMCGRQCLNATFSNRNAFWGNKIGAKTRIWEQTWNYFTSISEWVFKKGKGSKIIFRGLPTTLRHLNENTALCNLLNRNREFSDWHVSLGLN